MRTTSPPWLAYIALATSMALVGSYVALSKPLLLAIPVFVLAWLRFAIGALSMSHWLRRPADETPISTGTRWKLFAQSFFGNFLFTICMLYGVKNTSASHAGVILAALPAVVAVLSAGLLAERLTARALAAIALAVAGIMLYAVGNETTQTGQWWGGVLVFAAVCCEALYVVIGKSLSSHLSPKRVTALINLWGLCLITPLAIWQWPQWNTELMTWPLSALLVFYALAASVWTVWLWMAGLRHVDAHQAGVFTVMLPVSAATIGIAFLGETMSSLQVLAFAMALLGVWLVTSGRDLAKQT